MHSFQMVALLRWQALDAESYANGAGLLFPLGGGETRLPRTLRPGFGPTAYCTRAVQAFLVVRHLCRSLTGSITAAGTAATSSGSSSSGELLIAVEPAIARIAAGAQPLPDSAAAASLAAAAAAASSASGSFSDSCSSAAAAAGVHWAVAGELLPLAGRRRLCCRLQAQLGGSTSVSSAAAESALSSSAHSSSSNSGHSGSGHGGSSHGGSSSSNSSSSFNMCLVLDDPMQLLLVAYEGPAIVQQPTANGSSSSNSSTHASTSRRSPPPAPQHELGRIVGAIPYAHAAAVSHGLDRRAVELWAERSSAVNSGLTAAVIVQQQEQQLVPASALQARPSQSGAAVVAAAAAAVMNASAAALASAAAAVTGLPMANSSSSSSTNNSSDPAQPHIVLTMETSGDRAAVCAHVDSCRRALSCARLAALQDLLRQVIDALAVEGFEGASPSSTAPGSPEPACE
jgi:hypothetical protein